MPPKDRVEKFLDQQESKRRALIVIERLEHRGKIPVDDVQRQHGFVCPEGTSAEVLAEAEDRANEQQSDGDVFLGELHSQSIIVG